MIFEKQNKSIGAGSLFQNVCKMFAGLALLLAIVGMILCALAYVFAFFFIQNLETTAISQADNAIQLIGSIQPSLSSSIDALNNSAGAISSLSGSLVSYSNATQGVAGTFQSMSSLPPFSLNPSFVNSSSSLLQAVSFLNNASIFLDSSSVSVYSMSSNMTEILEKVRTAKNSLQDAKMGFKSSIGLLHFSVLIFAFSLEALFLSVVFVSIAVLFFLNSATDIGKENQVLESRKGQKKPEEPVPLRHEDLASLEEEVNSEFCH